MRYLPSLSVWKQAPGWFLQATSFLTSCSDCTQQQLNLTVSRFGMLDSSAFSEQIGAQRQDQGPARFFLTVGTSYPFFFVVVVINSNLHLWFFQQCLFYTFRPTGVEEKSQLNSLQTYMELPSVGEKLGGSISLQCESLTCYLVLMAEPMGVLFHIRSDTTVVDVLLLVHLW